MIKKTAIIFFSILLLSACGIVKKEDPKPSQTQVTLIEDIDKALSDLETFHQTQDEASDSALITE